MLARVPFSLGELVGGGGCNCAGDGDWNWGTGLRLRPPSPNKHSGEERTGWGGDAPRARKEARATGRAPRATWSCVGAGSREGCGTEVHVPLGSPTEDSPGLWPFPRRRNRRDCGRVRLPMRGSTPRTRREWGEERFSRRMGPQHQPAGKPPPAPPRPPASSLPAHILSHVGTCPFRLSPSGRSPSPRLGAAAFPWVLRIQASSAFSLAAFALPFFSLALRLPATASQY